MTKKHVGVERFIKTYMKVYHACGTQKDIADKLGVTPVAVCLRIKRLKKAGVKLPSLNGKYSPRYSADNLNKLVGSLQ